MSLCWEKEKLAVQYLGKGILYPRKGKERQILETARGCTDHRKREKLEIGTEMSDSRKKTKKCSEQEQRELLSGT